MQDRKEIREMFEKKHKNLAKQHALKNAINFMEVLIRSGKIDVKKANIDSLINSTIDIAKRFEAYLRGKDFIEENLEFATADKVFSRKIQLKTQSSCNGIK